MLTPAQNRLDGVQANYNQQLTKLRQMQIAVAGMRSNGGGWAGLSGQQQAFKPFGLRSYELGDLDFNLKRSLLITETEMETEEVKMAKANRAVVLQDYIDDIEALSIAGYSEEHIKEITTRRDAEPEPDIDPAVADAMRLANGGVMPRQLPAGDVREVI